MEQQQPRIHEMWLSTYDRRPDMPDYAPEIYTDQQNVSAGVDLAAAAVALSLRPYDTLDFESDALSVSLQWEHWITYMSLYIDEDYLRSIFKE